MLYCDGSNMDKTIFLFKLVQKSIEREEVTSNSFLLYKCLEYMVYISTAISGEKISTFKLFETSDEREFYTDLMNIYRTENGLMYEFAKHLSSQYIFFLRKPDDVERIKKIEFRMEEQATQ